MSVIKGTRLVVADNTGILIVECIGISRGRPVAKLGDVITVCAKKVTPAARKHWKNVHRAIIVRSVSCSNSRKSSDKISFSQNAVVMIDKDGKPVGTRFSGPMSKNLNNPTILSKAEVVL